MSYYISKTTKLSFEQALERVTEQLQQTGFGVLTEIDVRETLRQKLNVNFRRYKILGACNPPFAYQALQAEDHIGVMLPCNVVVQEKESGVQVSAIDPLASMATLKNEKLGEIAGQVRSRLQQVIANV